MSSFSSTWPTLTWRVSTSLFTITSSQERSIPSPSAAHRNELRLRWGADRGIRLRIPRIWPPSASDLGVEGTPRLLPFRCLLEIWKPPAGRLPRSFRNSAPPFLLRRPMSQLGRLCCGFGDYKEGKPSSSRAHGLARRSQRKRDFLHRTRW